jgi:hypothetical protein
VFEVVARKRLKRELTPSQRNILFMAEKYKDWEVSGAVLKSAKSLAKRGLVTVETKNIVRLKE